MKLVPMVCKSCGRAHSIKVDRDGGVVRTACFVCEGELVPDDVPVDPAGEQTFDKLTKSKPR